MTSAIVILARILFIGMYFTQRIADYFFPTQKLLSANISI